MLQCLDWLNEKIRIAKFDVLWKATVDDDENFSNTALENIEFVDQTTEIGWMNKLKYGFTESQPPKPQF